MDGIYGFVYSGDTGFGLGFFEIAGSNITGCDGGGGKYNGTITRDEAAGVVHVHFNQFMPAQVPIVQGTGPLDIPITRSHIAVDWPLDFANSAPIRVYIPPGFVTLMIRELPRDAWGQHVSGFKVTLEPLAT